MEDHPDVRAEVLAKVREAYGMVADPASEVKEDSKQDDQAELDLK
jgi:recombination protein RecA